MRLWFKFNAERMLEFHRDSYIIGKRQSSTLKENG